MEGIYKTWTLYYMGLGSIPVAFFLAYIKYYFGW